jgi:hypothetical protein
MSRLVSIIGIILIVGGLALVIYQDPQFKLIFASSTPAPATVGGSFFNRSPSSSGTSSSSVTVPFNSADIIESLLGAGLVGIGLVFLVFQMVSSSFSKKKGVLLEEKVPAAEDMN